jgi:hypothetical protein
MPVATVKASYANFVWGIPPERDSLYPLLGFSTSDTEGARKIIAIEKDSIAAAPRSSHQGAVYDSWILSAVVLQVGVS